MRYIILVNLLIGSSAAFIVLLFCPDKLSSDIFAYQATPGLAYDDLPHPHRKLSKHWSNRAFALHQWGMHQGKPEQRINRVKELGYLFVEELPPAACDRLPH